MMHVILNEGLEDRAYIAEMTHGFEALFRAPRASTRRNAWPLWTGMTPGEIEQNWRREYADDAAGGAAAEHDVTARGDVRDRSVRAICDAFLPRADGGVEDARRRRTAFDLGCFCVGQEGAGAGGSALASPIEGWRAW